MQALHTIYFNSIQTTNITPIIITMEKPLYLAAMEGNINLLIEIRDREKESGRWDNLIQSLTPQQNNVIHIASKFDRFEFLKSGFNFLNFSPLMISQRNANGDTPIHVASKRGNKKIVELLVETSKKFVSKEAGKSKEVVEEKAKGIGHGEKRWAWRVANFEGDTPLHHALINGKVEVAKCLLEVDLDLASFVNNNGETPLHLAIKYNVDGDKKLAIETIEQLNKRQASVPYKGCWSAEESVSVISLLLQKHKAAVYTRDKDGLTPLLRAALESHVDAVEMILKECPESAEMCDLSGKTVLHLLKFPSYEVAKKCLKNPHIFALKDQQDDVGNTPAHLVVMNGNELIIMEEQKKVLRDDYHHFIGVIRAFLESSANFSLKNKQGVSAAALLQQLISRLPDDSHGKGVTLDVEKMKAMLRKNKDTMESVAKNEDERSKEELEAIWNAVGDGDVYVLKKELKTLEVWLLDGILKLGDVVYILLEANRTSPENVPVEEIEELIKELIENNPFLISQINAHGDTFLHTMLRFGIEISDSFLDLIKRCCERALQQLNDNICVDAAGVCCPPWKIKNVEGNTPLHQALLHVPRLRIISFLLQCDKSVVTWVNNQGETPLHILCRTKGKEIKECKEVTTEIIRENIWATYDRDNIDGYTPLLRAAKEGKLEIVEEICSLSPKSAQLRDHEGKTFWHLLDMSQPEVTTKIENIFKMFEKEEYEEIKDLAYSMDNNGNTPFYLAVENHNYNLAQVLQGLTKTDIYSNFGKGEDDDFRMKYSIFILNIARCLPTKVEGILWKKMKMIRSSFIGVKDDEIKDYISTIGVIAALLATIAFTAAFAVPGGFDSSTGNPELLQHYHRMNCTAASHHSHRNHCIMGFHRSTLIRAAYWVFMVSDILTMCFAITILYCLLWIIRGNKEDKAVIADFSVLLLHPTFFTTMVALMMGVFASTFDTQPELAIFTVVACSITLLMFQRCVVMYIFKYLLLTVHYAWEVFKDWSAYKFKRTLGRQGEEPLSTTASNSNCCACLCQLV